MFEFSSTLLQQPAMIMALGMLGLLSASSLLSGGMKSYWGLKGFMETLEAPWGQGAGIPKSILDFHQRVKSWWLIAVVVLPLFVLGEIALIAAFAVVTFFGLREWLSSADLSTTPHRTCAAVLYFMVPVQFAVGAFLPGWMLVILPIILATRGLISQSKHNLWPLVTASLIVSAMAFVAVLLVIPMNQSPADGRLLNHNILMLAHILIVAQLSDGMQYAVGKVIGRTPLAKSISPNKTWEGAIGGGLIAIAVGTAFALFTPLALWQAVVLSLVVVVSGIAGGLVFSAEKRRRGIKDWSSLIPGHGGILDRLDSLVIAIPAYFIVMIALRISA